MTSAPPAQPLRTTSAVVPTSVEISALSLHSLRVELHRRNLPTTGLRSALEHRLHTALQAAATVRARRSLPVHLTVPSSFAPSSVVSRVLCLNSSPRPSPSRSPSSFPCKPSSPSLVTGVLRARSVWVCGDDAASHLWRTAGPLGKGNLSRSAPSFARPQGDNQKGRALRQLLEMEGTDEQLDLDQRANVEHLQLTLIEAFHAAFVRRVLVIRDVRGHVMDNAAETWRLFCKRLERFAVTFVVYCRYRSVGWVPRSGLKYGVDWVLYPVSESKRHTHAPFCVVLRYRDDGEPVRLERTWITLQNRLRLVKNVSKALVLAEVYTKVPLPPIPTLTQAFSAVSVSELTVDRWIP